MHGIGLSLGLLASHRRTDELVDRVTDGLQRAGGAIHDVSPRACVVETRDLLLSNTGLLLPRDQKKAGFYHLSFQEFLAAGRHTVQLTAPGFAALSIEVALQAGVERVLQPELEGH